tara:strand:- start:98 stop:508 length:411 start_codon:yes stop_codon:yes gene_type:complete
MSALETDLNPDVYIGLSLPIKRSENLDFSMTKTSLEQSKFNLRNLLLTDLGERVGQPTFGTRLKELVFENIDEELPSRIEEEVRRAVTNWLPYINILSIETLTDDADNSMIVVRVKYSTSLNPQTVTQVDVDVSSY